MVLSFVVVLGRVVCVVWVVDGVCVVGIFVVIGVVGVGLAVCLSNRTR